MTNRRCVVAGRPNLHAAGNEFVADLQALLGKVRGVNTGAHFHTKIDKLFHRALAQVLWKSSEHFRVAFDQNHARL